MPLTGPSSSSQHAQIFPCPSLLPRRTTPNEALYLHHCVETGRHAAASATAPAGEQGTPSHTRAPLGITSPRLAYPRHHAIRGRKPPANRYRHTITARAPAQRVTGCRGVTATVPPCTHEYHRSTPIHSHDVFSRQLLFIPTPPPPPSPEP